MTFVTYQRLEMLLLFKSKKEVKMKVYEVSFSGVKEGALVSSHKGLPAIVIGEEGRGREIGVLYVKGVPQKERVMNGKLTFIRDIPVLIANEPDDANQIMVVAYTTMGYRGHGYLRGAHRGWKLQYDSFGDKMSEATYSSWEAAHEASIQERKQQVYIEKIVPIFENYEPAVLARGMVADGMAGNVGSAEQLVFLASEGDIFSLYRTGRLYGGEPIVQFRVSSGKVEKYDESLDMLKSFLELGE